MKIVLLRHGKPDIPEFGKLRASEIRRWIESYNSAGIMKDHQPSREAVEIAYDNDSVLLVGHGFVNRFIAKELLSSGWQGPANPGKKYWEFGVYEYKAT